MVHNFDRSVNITGYDPKDGSKVSRTVTVFFSYDKPQTSKPYLLVINQDIQLDHLEHHLMCPMQCRTNGIKINETPKYQIKATYESTHAFQLEYPPYEEVGMHTIPFQLIGFTSYFLVCKPTNADWEDDSITKIELMAKDTVEDPTISESSEQ